MEPEKMYYIPNPTIRYKVGDYVIYSDKTVSQIIDQTEDGKILTLEIRDIDKSNEVKSSIKKVVWFDVIPHKKHLNIIQKNNKIINFTNTSILGLIFKAYSFGCNFNPPYQRENVWLEEDEIELIKSIFNQINIGHFVLIKSPYKENKPTYEVLDGKQRMTTLMKFFEGRFLYRNRSYFTLHPKDRRYFEEYPISVCILENITEKEKLEIFLRVNTYGKIQNSEHIEYVKKLLEKLD